VPIEATFQALTANFEALRDAVASLRLTVVEDRPPRNEVLLVERLGDAVEDLGGCLEEAAAAAAAALGAVAHPLDGHRARQALALAHERFIRAEYKLVFGLISAEQLEELARFGRRRGDEWLGWTGSVLQALEQCRVPLNEADEALLSAWQELSERLGAGSVSVQTTNIGQQISPAAPEQRNGAGRKRRDVSQDAMT
jgi:hypothetical protein